MRHAMPAGIPTIYLEPVASTSRRLVIWLPGFTDDKESTLPVLRELAAAGFVALSFDPVDHGARSHRTGRTITDIDSGQFVAETDGRLYRHFWSIEAETAEEVPRIIDWAEAELGVEASVGMGGKSMGGDIAVVAAGLDTRIEAVAACIATPDWRKPGSIYQLSAPNPVVQAQYERYDPLSNLARYRHCPAITFQCRAEDSVVPAGGAQRFAAALAPAYAHAPDSLEVVLDPGRGHELTPAMWRNSLAWFRRFLAPSG